MRFRIEWIFIVLVFGVVAASSQTEEGMKLIEL